MDDAKKLASWKESWKDWVNNSAHSQEAKRILKETGPRVIMEGVSDFVAQEFQAMKGTKGARNGTDVQESLNSMTLEELREHVKGDIPRLDGGVEQWKANRQHGAKKISKKVVEFVDDFDSFLAGFSGIVEVVKLVDNQYGGTASAVLFIMFATVKAKALNDKAILSSMKLLAHRLPDLDIYYQVYADDILAKMLSKAYVDVILFAQKATNYFQGRGLGRVVKGFTQPTVYADLEQSMLRNFQDIRYRCNALVSQRISELSQSNTNINDENESRKLRKKLLRSGHSEPLPKSTRNTQLDNHARLLAHNFDQYRNMFTTMTVAKLQSTPEYRDWSAAQSSMLILYGNNNTECTHPPQSWLSLVGVEYTQQLIRQSVDSAITGAKTNDLDNFIVAHVVGQRGDKHIGAEEALEAIADQIIEQQRCVLRRRSAADHITFLADSPTLEGRAQLLLAILDQCPPRPVFVLIDRLDLCAEDKTSRVITLLMNLVQLAKGRLKILLVFRKEVWDVDSRRDLIEKEWLVSKKLVLLRRDQL
ncbi:hypothetical protein CMQ_1069 [Grosmannia clavigera kw1407]|uniref:DUF7708 domain-containing protein n=1 Tax=Grosmannia clavigera (strain kw1407 / UAMH 11150) TaxID=655863 RepID=F0XCD1_GROCL|nr:uncharacterized protein CMQ_1069 [Grosmannia clavigera kw1407]EFX04141.1 hypothetical protein CMQ_1069 [Grosmannia clavigera kw1407]